MKKILLPQSNDNLKYYKANLHCHSTISDGHKTIEQLKQDYMKHGYSIIAYTDHDIFLTHNDLTDDNFLALNGYEMEINKPSSDWRFTKTCHMCLIAENPDIKFQPCYNENCMFGNTKNYITPENHDENIPPYKRIYSAECINEMFQMGKDNGFFVTYNHPGWSRESYPEYSVYKKMNAMEIVNGGCVIECDDNENAACYSDLLNLGNKIYCIATDDNHNCFDDTNSHCDSYLGYVKIASPKLNYDNVIKSLKEGIFYSATGNKNHEGPEFLYLEFDDNKVKVKAKNAKGIYLHTCSRSNHAEIANDNESIDYAEFSIYENEIWFRIELIDEYGFKAFSNAYFLSDLK